MFWRIAGYFVGFDPGTGVHLGRNPSIRSKGDYWYSEAGGKGQYFGRIDEVSKAEALARLWASLAGGRAPAPAPEPKATLKVAGLKEEYLAWVAKHRAKTNHRTKVVHLRRFADAYGKRVAESITGADLEDFLAGLSRHPVAYVRKHEVSVRAMFRWGVRYGHLSKGFTPFGNVEAVKPPAKLLLESDLPTPEEVQALIKHSSPRLADFLTVQWATGARTGELRAANVGDYQPKAGQIVLRHHKREKTLRAGGLRVITLNAEAKAIVARLARDRPADAPLFTTTNGLRWEPRNLADRFNRAKAKAGVRKSIRPYDLRHLWITDALQANLDILMVARMSGTSISMIDKVYGRFRTQSLNDAQSRLDASRKKN